MPTGRKKNGLVFWALIAAAGFTGYKFYSQDTAVKTDVVNAIRHWLIAEYQGAATQGDQMARKTMGAENKYLETSASSMRAGKFDIVSVQRHGDDANMVARVVIVHEGALPSEGTEIRFLELRRAGSRWSVIDETTQWNYYLAVF